MNYNSIATFRTLLKNTLTKSTSSSLNRVEFEVLNSVDDNNNKYAYIHLKDYGYEDDFVKLAISFKEAVVKKSPNAIEVVSVNDNDRKMLLWIPKDEKINTLLVDGETYSSLNSLNLKTAQPAKKIKIK